MSQKLTDKTIFSKIKELLHSARSKIVASVNTHMVYTYFEIGKIIIEYEQQGKEKAVYDKGTLKGLSTKLTGEFGKGFSVTNLKLCRSFYLTYSKSQTVSDQFNLSWSHYVKLITLNDLSRKFYEIETAKNNWGVRELERQISSHLFERLAINKNDVEIRLLSERTNYRNAKGRHQRTLYFGVSRS